jgi:hypothetical protein
LQTKDGADPQTEAAVKAYNDALLSGGPGPGQTQEEWALDLQEKHDALFGHTCQFAPDFDTTSCFDYTVTTETSSNLGPPVDLCNGAVSIWMTDPIMTGDPSQTKVAEAIQDPSLHATLTKNLAYYLWGMIGINTDPRQIRFSLPTYPLSPWSLSCVERKGFPGQFKSSMTGVTFPLQVRIAVLGVEIANPTGSVTFDANWSSRKIKNADAKKVPHYYWCAALNMDTYQTDGFGLYDLPVRTIINSVLGHGLLCNYSWDWNY